MKMGIVDFQTKESRISCMCVFFIIIVSYFLSLFLLFFVATSRKFNGDRWLREHEEKLLFAIYEDRGWRVLEDESADCKLKSEYSINEYSLGRFKSLWRGEGEREWRNKVR